MKRVTQSTIAKALGISPSTVGLVVGSCETRASKKLRPETIERIRAKAEELGYFGPDPRARSMRGGRSNLIGILHFGSPFETGQRSAFYLPQAVNAMGYDYLVIDLQWHGGKVGRVMREILQARVEGVLLTANYREAFSLDELSILKRAGIPVVSLYGDDPLPIPHIGDAARGSFREMTTHVIGLGHRHLLFPCGAVDRISAKGRIAGLREALPPQWNLRTVEESAFFGRSGYGETPSITVVSTLPGPHGNFTEDAFHFGRRLFAMTELPDAIMAFNDQAALGFFNAAFEKGVHIPKDIALVGADDDHFGRYPMFELTTIRQAIDTSCQAALETLVSLITDPEKPVPMEQEFPSQLIVRRSCGNRQNAS